PTYRVEVDERRTKLIGLDAATVQQWLDTAITGTIVGQVLEGDRAIPLRLRYPEQFRTALASMDGLTLVTQGRLAPLESLARLRAGPVAVQRSRENLRQVVRVTGRLEERDLGSAVRDAPALVGAGRVRLRPILMTSIAAGAGLAPLAVGLGAGAQMQQPLAIAILGGLSISMLFSLVGVPVLHVVLSGRRGSAQLTPAESSG